MKTRCILMLCLGLSALSLLGCNSSAPPEAPAATTKAPPAAAPTTGAKNGAQLSGVPAPEVNSNYQGGVGTKSK